MAKDFLTQKEPRIYSFKIIKTHFTLLDPFPTIKEPKNLKKIIEACCATILNRYF